jgi:hypothetical protein
MDEEGGLVTEPLSEERSSDGSHVGAGSDHGDGTASVHDHIIAKTAAHLDRGDADRAAAYLGDQMGVLIAPEWVAAVLATYRDQGRPAARSQAFGLGPRERGAMRAN